MHPERSAEARFRRVAAAFAKDGFEVQGITRRDVTGVDPAGPQRYQLKDGCMGVLAVHTRARNTRTGAPKRAYYLEGDGYHMGWLLGVMAERDVSRMAGEFVENVAFAFFRHGEAPEKESRSPLKDLIVRITSLASERMVPDTPKEILAEIDGLQDGCRWANSGTTVRRDRLLALNLGIDCLLAHIYTGTLFAERGFHPGLLRTPIGCNAFSISGDAAGGLHFFGRDFMFPAAGVFQDTACLFIQVPEPAHGEPARAFVSQGAPGLVGTIAALNSDGVAIGVDMLPSRLSDPSRPGFNSLLLIRDCIQHCSSANDAAERIRQAPRGVSWLYPIADAAGQALIVEAGRRLASTDAFPYFERVPRSYRGRLPDIATFDRLRRRYGVPGPEDGMVVRGRDYRLPDEYVQDWNPGLWQAFDSSWLTMTRDLAARIFGEVRGLFSRRSSVLWRQWLELVRTRRVSEGYSTEMFTENGFIDATWTDRNCPGPFYFAPQRERRPDVLIATNHCISPEMRLTSMNEWIALLSSGEQDDMQWRYDELNREIQEALAAGPVDARTAWDIANFLRPNGKFPRYYNEAGRDWREVVVNGSVSLAELTSRTFTSLFGYYGDEPVSVHLKEYV